MGGTNILVENCNISVGDDDFTCGGGTSGVLLTNNTYGSGHGVSIGSYTDDGGVSNITVIHCTFNGTGNGIRIKSDNDRGGLVQNISYYNLSMTNVGIPIQIYSYYDEVGTPNNITPQTAAAEPVAAVSNTTPIYRNITFSNVTATAQSGNPVGIIWARTEMPATNIVFDKLNLAGSQGFDLYNVSGAQFIDPTVNVPSGTPTFELFNARIILTNSAPTNTLCTFDGLTTNAYLDNFALDNAQASLENTNAFGTGPLTLSASTLTVSNNLTLFPATTLNYRLGTNAAKLAVVGGLALGGTNNISAGSGFTNGTYTLMTYTGTLSGSPPVLGSTPTGYYYDFDTATPGEVNLVVSNTAFAVPAAPANLIAAPGVQLVTLSWSPPATTTSYEVKRSTTNNGTYPTIFSGILATNYTDTQVTNGTTYYYVVSAVNAAGMGANSAIVNATPEAGVVTGGTSTVFNDVFSTSTVDSTTPSAPTGTATSYEVVSSKPWSPTPGAGAGHLKYGIGTTSSGCVEMEALFTSTPFALASVGDSLSLTVTFTNTSGLLTQPLTMGFGLFASGQNEPVPGGLNGKLSSGSSDNATGNAQSWSGFVAQLAFTGDSSFIMTRPPQTGADNNNQDVVTSGSSASYSNPAGTTVGTASSAPSITLVAGNPYTEELTITLMATNTLAITNFLYSGTNTIGALLSQFGGEASGATYLTNTFDALGIGWRAMSNTNATEIDINQITVNETVAAGVISLIPPKLVCQKAGGQLQLSWPADHLGWRLESQTNTLNQGLWTNWATVANSTNVDSLNLSLNPTNGAVFLRLVYP